MIPVWAAPLVWIPVGLTACYLTVAVPRILHRIRNR